MSEAKVEKIKALFRVDFSGVGELSERQQKVSVPYFVWLATLFINIFVACSGAPVVR